MIKENRLVKQIEKMSHRFGDKVALDVDGTQISYGDFLKRIGTWRDYFHALGLVPGTRVMMLTDHRLDFLAVLLALWQLDCIPIPLEPSVAGNELERAMIASDAHWILSANSQHATALPAQTERVPETLQPAWLLAKLDSTQVGSDSDVAGAFFIYTSGTTGTPKCVVYDQATVTAIIDSLIYAYHLTAEDVIMTPLSPALSATLITGLLPGLACGATLVLPSQPIPGRVLKQVASTQTTIFFAVPYFYNLLIEAMNIRQGSWWDTVRLVLSTSAYLPGHTFDAFYALTQLPIRSIYCTSEANQCTFNTSTDMTLLRSSVGQPQLGVRLRVVDELGQDTAVGEEGQIIVSGTHLSKGYFKRPDLEAKVYQQGWVHTGDLGVLDAEHNLYLTGRLSDTINVGGHLVNPQEVETVLLAHSAVAGALVLGEGDALVGEHVIGWVVIKEGQQVSAQEIIEHCKDSLIHYKVPVRVEFVDELPVGRYGKIRRLTPVPQLNH